MFFKEKDMHLAENPKANDARKQLEKHRDLLVNRLGNDYAEHPLFRESVAQLVRGRALQSVLLDLQGH